MIGETEVHLHWVYTLHISNLSWFSFETLLTVQQDNFV